MLDLSLQTVRASSDEGMFQSKVQDLEGSVQRRDLKRASEKFEAYFLSYLLKVMRDAVPKGGLIENRMGEVFHSFYDEEIARRSAESGGIGLAQLILSSLADEPEPPAQD